MFWKKKKNDTDDYPEMLNQFKVKEGKMDDITKRLDNLEKDNQRLNRIVRYGKPNEITFNSVYENGIYGVENVCYIYKDGIEYCIKGLGLINPKFELSDVENVIYVSDKYTRSADMWNTEERKVEKKYTIDLIKCTYITIKK